MGVGQEVGMIGGGAEVGMIGGGAGGWHDWGWGRRLA